MLLQSCYIFRSVSHRKLYKTSGSRSQNYITTTTQTTQKSSLSDDYDTPTGDSNPSSCADFLADMFDRTAEVYHHHLRYIHEMCTFHYNLYNRCCVKFEYKMYLQYTEMYIAFQVNYMMQDLRLYDVLRFVPILGTTLNSA